MNIWHGIGVAAGVGIIAAGVVLGQGGAVATPGLFPYADNAVAAEGQGLYADYCAACHGTQLEGQADWRVPLANGRLPAPPHDVSGHTWHHPDAQLFDIVKYGTAALVGGSYQSDMAGYEEVLTDDQIIAVMAYIKSTWPADIIARHDEMNRRLEVAQ
ncbi:cytochrome c [uncultured Tateyamaria sp.]|uniref:c-type cytochrome n=1 Tax=uncultured Tateyamaria sp. TaxID=455651 RepID=UPI002638F9AB|nr:cytochrome c [uncultured Tateyamaria sp.]